MAIKLYDHSISEIGNLDVYDDRWKGCSGAWWVTTSPAQVEYVILPASRRVGTVTSATLAIRADGDSPNVPGTVIGSQTFNPGTDWSTSFATRTITFDTPVNISKNTVYCLVLNCNGTDSNNRLEWSRSSTGGHWWSIDSGSSWDRNLIGDANFEIWGVYLAPSKATNPTPADSATSVDFSNRTLSWDDGGGADTFDVYVGPQGNLSLVSSAQAGTSKVVDTGDIPWGVPIYWRIDSTNATGTTTGDTWSFENVVVQGIGLGANGNFIVVAAINGVYLSTDQGDNWTRKEPDGVSTTDWTKGKCSSTGTYIIVVSDANAIYRSANSGSSWGVITPAGGDTYAVSDLACSDDGQYWVIVGTNSTDATESCYISTDYGVTWTSKKPVAVSIAYTECDISNDGAIIAVSRSAYFYISLDSGATWTEQGMASTATTWGGLSIAGGGTKSLIANTDDNNEYFVGVKTNLYSRATWSETTLTGFGRSVLDDADAPTAATTLGLGIGDSPILTGLTLSGIADTRVLYSNVTSLAGDSAFTFNNSTKVLTTATFNATDEDDVLQIDGTSILRTGTTANYNLFLGVGTFNNADGSFNIGVGFEAGRDCTTGVQNTFVGYRCGSNIENGSYNFGFGSNTLLNLKSGNRNIGVGWAAGQSMGTGSDSVFIGSQAGNQSIIGGNVAIGSLAMYRNRIGQGNVEIGKEAGLGASAKSHNYCTFIGYNAGRSIGENAHRNNCIGYKSGFLLTTGTANVYLGYDSGYNQTTLSNILIIDNQDRGSAAAEITDCLIYGVFNATPASQSLRLNVGNLYFGNPTHSDADGGGLITQSFIREDGSGTATSAASIAASHDGVVADDQLGKLVLSVNTGAGLVQALEIGSDLLATFAGGFIVDATPATVYINYTATNSLGLISIQENGANSGGIIKYGTTHASLSSQLWIKNYDASGSINFGAGGGGTSHLYVKSDGNVGINDVTPAEKLDVSGNTNVTGVYKVDDTQVISNRVIDARCDDAINSGDATTDGVIDSLRDAMITHGLIAAS